MRPGDMYQKNFEDNFKIFKNFTEMSKNVLRLLDILMQHAKKNFLQNSELMLKVYLRLLFIHIVKMYMLI